MPVVYLFQRCLLTLLVLSGAISFLQAQVFSGNITNPEGEALVFVSVIAESNSERRVALSDIEGRFQLELPAQTRSITFRYVGYEDLRLSGSALPSNWSRSLAIRMSPASNTLTEVRILAGENPAHRIIRLAVEQRIRNNPERRGAFTCVTYNKVTIASMLDRKRFEAKAKKEKERAKFDQMEQNANDRQLLMMETVTERSFLPPTQVQEKVLLNRVSGFKNPDIVTLANVVQPFSFYGDYLPILDKNFVNPISPGSTNLYFFNIEDTLYQGIDTVWVISFKPRKGKVFMGLKGVLHINSNQYAIQNVLAEPAFGAEVLRLKLEQAYQYIQQNPTDTLKSGWFPSQLNFELNFPNYPAEGIGLHAAGRSYLTDVSLNAPLRIKDFNAEQPILIAPSAQTRDSARWDRWHQMAPLHPKEVRTYSWMDSIGQEKKLDTWAKVISALSTGVWPLREPIGLDVRQIIRLNDFEGARLGIGLTNARFRPLSLARRLEWRAYSGYGFRDKNIKYGGSVLWRIQRGWQTHLSVGYRYDLTEPGAPYELLPPALVNRTLYARRMDLGREAYMVFSSRIANGLSGQIAYRNQDLQPAGYTYRFLPAGITEPTGRFQFQEATAGLRFAYGEQLRTFLGSNAGTTNRLPAVELAYTRGWGNFTYERWLGALYQSVFVRRLGWLNWRVEGGISSPDAPLAKLFTLNQTGGQYGNVAISQTFQALPDTLFLHDRFVNVFVTQEIGPVLYQRKYSAPFLTLHQSMAWGRLSNPQRHQEIGFRSVDDPTFESGIRLDNLLRFNYVNFMHLGIGGALFYRWGYLADPNWRNNLVPRFSLRLGF